MNEHLSMMYVGLSYHTPCYLVTTNVPIGAIRFVLSKVLSLVKNNKSE
jgi:hypothetical protein